MIMASSFLTPRGISTGVLAFYCGAQNLESLQKRNCLMTLGQSGGSGRQSMGRQPLKVVGAHQVEESWSPFTSLALTSYDGLSHIWVGMGAVNETPPPKKKWRGHF